MSPSKYGNPRFSCRYSATDVFPQPAGPVMTQMCLCAVAGAFVGGGFVPLCGSIVAPDVTVAGSEGGVGGNEAAEEADSMVIGERLVARGNLG